MKTESTLSKNLDSNLLLESPYLEAISNPFQRFYMYRALEEFKDRDRCDTAQEIYKSLNWYDDKCNYRNLLEPDTFFASSHNLMRQILKKYDNKYFIEDFKRYIEEQSINYEKLSDESARYYRYLWMVIPSTIYHYDSIVNNPSVLDYI